MTDSSKNDSDRKDRPGKPKFPGKPPRGRAPPPPVQQAKKPDEAQRIAKVMARAGLCSRRDAEGWIAQGRVDVNGITLTSPAFNVQQGDRISVDGVMLAQREPTRLFAFHKPRGFVTTVRDPECRPTIFDHLGTVAVIGSDLPLPRTVTIGRLDINTEGLLLLTNDGGLARVLELPSTGWLRRYRVRANGSTDQSVLDSLRSGLMIDGVEYMGIEATLDRVQGANLWLTMGLREGKNREIKRVLEHIGLAVTRLIRISFGPFQLGELGEGAVEEIKTRVLKDQLGPNLIAESGADFESPALEPGSAAARGKPEVAGVVPRDRPEAGPRKHVSALRAERDDKHNSGPRARVERSATQDRKGRDVKVERVVAAGSRSDAPVSRNARRFAEGGEARPARDDAHPARTGERPARTGERPARTGERPARTGERPARDDGRAPKKHFRGAAGDAPARSHEGRPPREDFRGAKPGGEKRFGRPRPGEQKDDRAASPRAYGKDRPQADRPARDDRPERPDAPSGSFKGARRFSASGKPFSENRGPRAAKFGAEKSGGDRPEGKSFGDKKFGDKKFGAKPFGARSGGAKPAGAKPFRASPDGRPSGPRPPRRPG